MRNSEIDINFLRERLSELEAKCDRLQRENANLRERLGEAPDNESSAFSPSQVQSRHSTLSETDKLRLFRSLFRGRQDVYPTRWENRAGKGQAIPPSVRTSRKRPHLCKAKDQM